MNADVAALASADRLDAPPHDRNPFAFVPAIAPHLAAREAGEAIDLGRICAAWRRLGENADVIVVEGAGGALVPLGDDLCMLDIASRLRVPVLLVVGIRLGCLNHALLTMEAITTRGLALAGWVANRIDPAMSRADENVADLARRIRAPLVADIGWRGTPVFDAAVLGELGLTPLPQRRSDAAAM
jgi:dethiobiotin synthetase